jgi:membrane protease YdiL (CAAX protease family)
VPSRSRVALELLDKLGITRSELFGATTGVIAEPPGALVAGAIACAAGLPACLHKTRKLGAGMVVQSIVFVGFGILAPFLLRRVMDPDHKNIATAPTPPAKIMVGVVVGLALTAAAVTAGRLFFDTGTELARCVNRLDAEARIAHSAEAAELANAIAKVRASAPLVVMTSAVFPFAEERIYRGLLQDVLARKYGASYGVFAASLAFGVAHLGIYQVALYQTVLLGIGFGVAYAEGGLLAAFVVHATWNLVQLG